MNDARPHFGNDNSPSLCFTSRWPKKKGDKLFNYIFISPKLVKRVLKMLLISNNNNNNQGSFIGLDFTLAIYKTNLQNFS